MCDREHSRTCRPARLAPECDEFQLRPRVSVITASFNYGKFIRHAIESVIAQTYRDWEMIIVDDGSTDDTTEVVKPYLEDPRIQYYWQENHGQSHARNVGILRSRGVLVAFLDADDQWLPEKLAKQVTLFDADANLGVAYTGMSILYRESSKPEIAPRKMVRGFILKDAFRQTVPPLSSAMVRRDVLDDIGMFDVSLSAAEDYDLWLRVATTYPFDFVDEPLLIYRSGHASQSQRSVELLRLVLGSIIPRFVETHHIRERLGRRVIAEVYASAWLSLARESRASSRWLTVYYQLRALTCAPWHRNLWREVARSYCPDFLVRFLKRAHRHADRGPKINGQ